VLFTSFAVSGVGSLPLRMYKHLNSLFKKHFLNDDEVRLCVQSSGCGV